MAWRLKQGSFLKESAVSISLPTPSFLPTFALAWPNPSSRLHKARLRRNLQPAFNRLGIPACHSGSRRPPGLTGRRNEPSCDRPVPAYDGECRPTWRWPRYHGLCPWGSIATYPCEPKEARADQASLRGSTRPGCSQVSQSLKTFLQ
jgi:hypothetical protein